MSRFADQWRAEDPARTVARSGEGTIIELARKAFGEPGRGVILGIGDDAAAVRPPKSGLCLVTTDTMVETVHFTRETTGPLELGWKALAANVSDIASMGGRAEYAVVSMGFSGHEPVSAVRRIIRGLKKASERYGVRLVGGDTVRAPVMMITVALWGRTSIRGVLRRDGARPGDEIWVTGTLGGSHLGLRWLLDGRDPGDRAASQLVRRHTRPDPPAEAMARLFDKVKLHAGCDLSDGLAVDLGHILAAGGVGAVLALEQLPLPAGAGKLGRILGVDPWQAALYGGEEYEMLFTASSRQGAVIDGFLKGRGIRASRVGGIVEKSKGFRAIGADGPFTPDPASAFQHFA